MKKLIIITLVIAAAVAIYFAAPGTTTLDSAIAYLDSDELSFTVGDVRISVYTFLKTLVTIIILFWIAAFISNVGQRWIRHIKKLSSSNREIFAKTFQITVYIIAFFVGLEVLGINLTAFAVIGGAIGVGIGFGLQKITSNFISGLILLLEKSIRLDDIVELSDGTFGFIRKLGARYTMIETFDGRDVLVPNEDFIVSKVTSFTLRDNFGRIEIPIGVSYKSDLDKVYDILMDSAKSHPRCSKKREPFCVLSQFGDSSVNYRLFMWVDDVQNGKLAPQSEVMKTVWDKFKEEGVEIPFPQRDLHFKNALPAETFPGGGKAKSKRSKS